MLFGGVSDACPFRTHTPLYYSFFCTFSGDVGVETSNADFFVCKDLRSVLTKLGERFVSPVQGSSVTYNFL